MAGRREARSGSIAGAVLLLLAGLGAWAGCKGAGILPDPKLCLSISASANLNPFRGKPHAVALYIFPVRNATSFQDADARDLVDGLRPRGLEPPMLELSILPDEKREIDEPLPQGIDTIGIVADYFDGPRKVLFDAACGAMSTPNVVLTSKGIQLE